MQRQAARLLVLWVKKISKTAYNGDINTIGTMPKGIYFTQLFMAFLRWTDEPDSITLPTTSPTAILIAFFSEAAELAWHIVHIDAWRAPGLTEAPDAAMVARPTERILDPDEPAHLWVATHPSRTSGNLYRNQGGQVKATLLQKCQKDMLFAVTALQEDEDGFWKPATEFLSEYMWKWESTWATVPPEPSVFPRPDLCLSLCDGECPFPPGTCRFSHNAQRIADHVRCKALQLADLVQGVGTPCPRPRQPLVSWRLVPWRRRVDATLPEVCSSSSFSLSKSVLDDERNGEQKKRKQKEHEVADEEGRRRRTRVRIE